MHLDDVSVNLVKKIVALKAEGKRNKDIKQMFDEQKKREQKKVVGELGSSKEISEDSAEVTETVSEADAEQVKQEAAEAKEQAPQAVKNKSADASQAKAADTKEAQEDKITEDKQSSEVKTENKEETFDAEFSNKSNSRSGNSRKRNSDRKSSKAKEDAKAEQDSDEPNSKEESEPEYIKSFIESEEQEAKMQIEQDDPVAEALALDEEAEDFGEDLEDLEDIEEEDIVRDSISPRKVKRKAFSFRYIQRQIASDTKKVNYLKNKLKKSKLSHLERLNLRDSLDKRAKMLSSWIQILRWVKS